MKLLQEPLDLNQGSFLIGCAGFAFGHWQGLVVMAAIIALMLLVDEARKKKGEPL